MESLLSGFLGVLWARLLLRFFAPPNLLLQRSLSADPAPGPRTRGGSGCECLQETPEQGLRRQTRLGFGYNTAPGLAGTRRNHEGDKAAAAASRMRGRCAQSSPSPGNGAGSCIIPLSLAVPSRRSAPASAASALPPLPSSPKCRILS